MRVWIVNPFDNLPQEGTRPQRYWLMAEAFARAGHEVALWSADFSHARKAKREFVRDVEAPFRLELVRTPAYAGNVSLARVWSHMAFARRWKAAALKEGAVADAVVASVPPLSSGLAALGLRRRGAFFVADVMDAWPETFERVAPRWALAPLRLAAGRIYRGADAVTCVAERYAELARAYGARGEAAVFHHGIDLEGAAGRKRPRKREGGRFRIGYAGNMGRSYDLKTLVEAVKAVEGAELELAGGGPDEARLRELAAGCGRIVFRGQLGEEELAEMLAGCDAGAVPMFAESCVGVPYKLADYAAAGLPVLNSLEGETAELLRAHGAGATYAAGDAAACAAAIRELAGGAAEGMRAGASRLAEKFSARKIYAEYVRWVEGKIAGRNERRSGKDGVQDA